MTFPLYRAFDVTVISVERLSSSFIRVTLGGVDIADFAPEGVDQRIKVLLPNSHGHYPDVDLAGEGWYAAWCALHESERPPMRTYTVRRWRRQNGELQLDVDFVLHGDGVNSHSGPASRWVQSAAPGDEIKIVGPDARSGGPWASIAWNPPATAERFILAGDETAAPAIAAIIESLPDGTSTNAFIEVPSAGDVLDIRLPTGVELSWLPRDCVQHGSLLAAAVIGAMPIATGDVYAWLAGESGSIKRVRRHLVRDIGMDRRSVAFMGYWREGVAER